MSEDREREQAAAKRAALTNSRQVERPAQGQNSGTPTVGYGHHHTPQPKGRRKKE
jgi:hypothetical protein